MSIEQMKKMKLRQMQGPFPKMFKRKMLRSETRAPLATTLGLVPVASSLGAPGKPVAEQTGGRGAGPT